MFEFEHIHIGICTLIYPTIWAMIIALETMPFSGTMEETLRAFVFFPTPGYKTISSFCKGYDNIGRLLTVLISCITPIVITKCCMIHQSYVFSSRGDTQEKEPENNYNQKKMTILLLLSLFLVFNVGYLIVRCVTLFEVDTVSSKLLNPKLIYVVCTILPFVNSALNPIVFIAQNKVLRNSVKRKFRKMLSLVFGVCAEPQTIAIWTNVDECQTRVSTDADFNSQHFKTQLSQFPDPIKGVGVERWQEHIALVKHHGSDSSLDESVDIKDIKSKNITMTSVI